MANPTCPVANCEKPLKRGGYCYGHYMKNWRYGTPTPNHPPKWEDIRGEKFGTLTPIKRKGQRWLCQCDCGGTALKFASALNRNPDANTCSAPGKHLVPGYFNIHDYLNRSRGPAKNYQCISCDAQALHWSYDHLDPDERHEDGISDQPVAYTMNPDHYQPRCVPCHKRYDLDRQDANVRGVA